MVKAVFLDRDGIVNIDKRYVHRKEEFEFTDGIFELCKFFQERNFLIFVITNQAGIGRGYYTEDDFSVLTDWMKNRFKENGILITDVYYCPHHPKNGIGKYKIDCECRKPNPGMILEIAEKHSVDLSSSVLIGDKTSDIEAGISAKIKNNFLIKSEYQNEYDFKTIRNLLNYLEETAI